MAAPLLLTDPRRRRGQAGSSLVQVERTTPADSGGTDETRQQQLTSLSEEEKLTAIFVSTLGGTVAAVPTADPGDDETSEGMSADVAEITGRGKAYCWCVLSDQIHALCTCFIIGWPLSGVFYLLLLLQYLHWLI
jgi:hypothetical protein